MSSFSQQGNSPQQWRNSLCAALVTSLTIALLDITRAVTAGHSYLQDPLAAALPLSALTLSMFAGYFAIWLPLQFWFGRKNQLAAAPLAVAAGAILLAPCLAYWVADLAAADDSARLAVTNSWKQWPVAAVVAAFAVTSGLAGYVLTARVQAAGGGAKRLAGAFFTSLPVLCLLLLAYNWLRVYAFQGLRGLSILAALALALIAFLLHLRASRTALLRLHAALLVAALTAGLFTLAVSAKEGHPGMLPPVDLPIQRVLLLTVDTLRADAVTYGGGPPAATPNIDRLARDGVVFTQAFSSAPWTLPAFASIMTGVTPWVHGAGKTNPRLPAAIPTLAEYFQQAGYLTAAVGFNSWLSDRRGDSSWKTLSSGFDSYEFFPRNFPPGLAFRLARKLSPRQYRTDLNTDAITRRSLELIGEHQDQSFLLWTHYFDPHDPFAPPPAFAPGGLHLSDQPDRRADRQWSPTPQQVAALRALYEAETRYVDDRIGRLLDALQSLGLYDDMLIVFTSDHGEEFYEHGEIGHGQSLHDEVIHVPLIVKLPRSPVTRRVDTAVSTASLLPTILDLAGITHDKSQLTSPSLQGFWDMSANADSPAAQPIFAKGLLRGEPREGVIFGGRKYIEYEYSARKELYERDADPREMAALDKPQEQQQGQQLLEQHRRKAQQIRESYGLSQDGADAALDEETLRKLKSLGYL